MLPAVVMGAAFIRFGEKRPAWRDFVLRVHLLVLCVYFLLALQIVSAIIAPTRLFRSGLISSSLIMPMLASSVIQMFHARRIGNGLYCARCGYEKSPAGTGLQCPECGSLWDGQHGVTRGRKVRIHWYVVTGVITLVIGIGLALATIGNSTTQGLVARTLLSTAVTNDRLIDDLSRQRYWSQESWEYLAGRSLSDKEFERVFQLVAKQFETFGRPSAKANDCMGPLLASPNLTDVQVGRLLGLAVHPMSGSFEKSAPDVGRRVISVMDSGAAVTGRYSLNQWCSLFVFPPSHSCGGSTITRVRLYGDANSTGVSAPVPLNGISVTIEIERCDASSEEVASWSVPIMIVGMPIGVSPGPASIGTDGSFIPPAGALWSRVVPVRVKVEQPEKK